MVKFIRQEAEEKSNEIKVSAEEVREITIIIPNCLCRLSIAHTL